jgi:hypothetical protein
MTDRVVRKLHFTPKLLLRVAGWLTVAAVALFVLVAAAQSRAQSPTDNKTQSIADTWQGTLHAGQDLRVVFKISKTDGGGYKAVTYSIDQGGNGIPVDTVTLDGTMVKMSVKMIAGTYEGKLSGDGKTITGTWTQGAPLPLTLTRATPETEWTIPPPGTPRSSDGRECQPQLRSRHHQAERSQSARQGVWIQGGSLYHPQYQFERSGCLCLWAACKTADRCTSLVRHRPL